MSKMRNLLLSALAFTGLVAQAATGDRWSTAVTIGAGASLTRTCVNEYDDTAEEAPYNTGRPVYYFKLESVPKGTPVILSGSALVDSMEVMGAIGDAWDTMHFEDVSDESGVKYAMSSEIGSGTGCWDENDPDTVTFYVAVYGDGYWDANYYDSGSFKNWTWDTESIGHGVPSITLTYKQEEHKQIIPLGSYENPERITMPAAGTTTLTRTEPSVGEGYYFLINLAKGRSYSLKTTSGTENNIASITAPSSYVGMSDPPCLDLECPAYNNGYMVMPTNTEDYVFSAASVNGTVTIEYGVIPGRLPEQHAYANLTCGVAKDFTPGRLKSEGSPYEDEVIDEVLFRFPVAAGRRYAAKTSGATADLLLRFYDAAGQILAENRGMGGGNLNVFATVTASNDGYLYVGICKQSDSATCGQCTITVTDVEGEKYKEDDFDPDDDDHAYGATTVVPTLTADSALTPSAGFVTADVHSLSLGDWSDSFAFAGLAGFTYKMTAVATAEPDKGLSLKATVYRRESNGGYTVIEGVSGAIDGVLEFTADANGEYHVVLTTAVSGAETAGRDYPNYKFHIIAYKADASSYGYVKAVQKGLPEILAAEAGWNLVGDTGANYHYGVLVPAKGSVNVGFSAMEGFGTPVPATAVSVEAGKTNVVTAVYNDAFDPTDDTPAGATEITLNNFETTASRTLFAKPMALGTPDTNDWFRFEAKAGVYYNFRFNDRTVWNREEYEEGAAFVLPGFTITDVSGREQETVWREDGTVSFGPEEDGTYYLCIAATDVSEVCCGFSHPVIADYSYEFAYWSVDVGTVSFASAEFAADRTNGFATVTLRRTSTQGFTAVRWMTGAGTATPGEDYVPEEGIVAWNDGEQSDKQVRIKLIPAERDGAKDALSFIVRAVSVSEEELWDMGYGETLPEEILFYPAVVATPDVAKVTIGASGEKTGVGQVGFTAWGSEKTPFANPEYPELTVAPGTPIRLWASRTGGTDGVVEMEFTILDQSAIGCSDADEHVLRWEEGESGDKPCGIRIVDFEETPDGDLTVLARLSVPGVGEGEIPELGATRVVIHVDPSLPPFDPLPADPSVGELVRGDFSGVLYLETAPAVFSTQCEKLAKVDFTADAANGLSATVRVAGREFVFTAADYDPVAPGSSGEYRSAKLTCNDFGIGGETVSAELLVDVYNGAFASLEDEAWYDYAEIRVKDAGNAVVYGYSGYLNRDNREVSAYRAALAPYVGRYNVALVKDIHGTDGFGTLSVMIAEDGSSSIEGILSDGRALSLTSTAYVYGSTCGRPDVLLVPVYDDAENRAFGGNLAFVISKDDGVLPYADEYGVLHDCANAVDQALTPVGGYYDPTISLQNRYADFDLLAVGDGIEPVSVGLSGDALLPATNALVLTFNRQDGMFSGNYDGRAVEALFTPVRDGTMDFDSFKAFGRIVRDGGGNGAFNLCLGDWYSSGEYWDVETDLTFDGNGNTAGSVPEPMIGRRPGDIVALPTPDPDFVCGNLGFGGWTDADGAFYRAGAEYTVPVANQVLSAAWTYSTDGFLKALDCEEHADAMELLTDGSAGWATTEKAEAVGGLCLKSGTIANGQNSRLLAYVNGGRRLTFSWACSCDTMQYAFAIFSVDGVEQARIAGTRAFADFSVDLTDGTHVLEWTYYRRAGARATGSDCVWLDNVRFGNMARVVLNPNGGVIEEEWKQFSIGYGKAIGDLPEPELESKTFKGWYDETGTMVESDYAVTEYDLHLTAKWAEKEWIIAFDGNGAVSGSADPAFISTNAGCKVTLAGAGTLYRGEAYELGGWEFGGVQYPTNHYPFVVPSSNITMKAVWKLSGIEKALGPGAAKFSSITTDDVNGWIPSEHAGSAAMRSGVIANGQQTTLTAVSTNGPGVVSFDWAVSCDIVSYAWVAFYVNGVEKARIGGSATDWRHLDFEVDGSADNTLTWVYSQRAGARSSGENCAWLANLNFSRKITITLLAEGGSPAVTNLQVLSGTTVTSLPQPTWTDYTFDHWVDAQGRRVDLPFTAPESDITLAATKKAKEWAVVYDLNGGESSVEIPTQYGAAGSVITLATSNTLSKAGCSFAGWLIGDKTYASGAKYTVRSGDVSAVALWEETFYAEALKGHGAENLAFTSEGSAKWIANAAAVGLQSGAIARGASSVLNARAKCAGTLTFEWGCSCDLINYAFASFSSNEVSMATIGGINPAAGSLTVHVAAGDAVAWTYTKRGQAYNRGSDCAFLYSVSFVPDESPSYDVSVRFGANVSNVTYAVTGEAPVTKYADFDLSVEAGKEVRIEAMADVEHWYYITGGTGVVSEAATVNVTAAKRDSGSLPADITPAELGFDPQGPFGSAERDELVKAMAWAQKQGKTVSDMNALVFTPAGDPVGTDAEAYLLNCAPADVETAKAAFRFDSFDPANPPTPDYFAGCGYNGRVLILKATTLENGGDWDEQTENARFYKARLVK